MTEKVWTVEALKEYFEKQMEGQAELYRTVQNLSNMAISKQEASQNQYNIGHNDLTRKMEAQYKEMLPRTESDSKFKNIEDKVSNLTTRLDIISGRGSGTDNFGKWVGWAIAVAMFLLYVYNLKK